MRDVAARAQVSAMTVSRVLKDDERVSPATRAKVLTAVEELGYRRNEVARNLRLGKHSGMIGLVVTNLANPFYSRLALGAEQVAEEHGLRLVLGNTAEQVKREQELVEDLVSRRVDGMIVVPAGASQRHLAPEVLGPTPVVLAGRPPAGIEADTVLVDDFGGAHAATARLIADGHRSIGFVGNPPALFTGAERFRGYRAAHEEAGLTPARNGSARARTTSPGPRRRRVNSSTARTHRQRCSARTTASLSAPTVPCGACAAAPHLPHSTTSRWQTCWTCRSPSSPMTPTK